MPTLLPDISSIPTDQLRAVQQLLLDSLAAANKDVASLHRGSALYTQLIDPAGILHAANQQDAQLIAKLNSISALESNAANVTAAQALLLLGNYGITQLAGTMASGVVRIYLRESRYTVISPTAVFTASGVDFHPTESVVGVPNNGTPLQQATDVRLTNGYLDGQAVFYFDVPVVALTAGSAGNVDAGSQFTSNLTSATVLQVQATGDFFGGADTETVQQLIDRAAATITSATSVTNAGMSKLLVAAAGRTIPFNSTRVVSRGIPMQVTRVRTSDVPVYVVVRTTAVYTAGKWVVTLTPEQVPGVISVVSLTADGRTTSPTTVIRGVNHALAVERDWTAPSFGSWAIGSVYQTLRIEVASALGAPLPAPVEGEERATEVLVYGFRNIREIDAAVQSSDWRMFAIYPVASAMIPCATTATIRLHVMPGAGTTDEDLVRAAVAQAVNTLPAHVTRLDVGRLLVAASQVLPVGVIPSATSSVNGTIPRLEQVVVYPAADNIPDVGPAYIDKPRDLGVPQGDICFTCNPADVFIEYRSL